MNYNQYGGDRSQKRLLRERNNHLAEFTSSYVKNTVTLNKDKTPEEKKKALKLYKDLKNTINKFWKDHDINRKIK